MHAHILEYLAQSGTPLNQFRCQNNVHFILLIQGIDYNTQWKYCIEQNKFVSRYIQIKLYLNVNLFGECLILGFGSEDHVLIIPF